MDIGEYKDNFKVFYEKFTYPKSINKVRPTITRGTHISCIGNSPLSSLSIVVMRIQHEIKSFNDPVNTTRV